MLILAHKQLAAIIRAFTPAITLGVAAGRLAGQDRCHTCLNGPDGLTDYASFVIFYPPGWPLQPGMNPSTRNAGVHHLRWLYAAPFTNYAQVLVAVYTPDPGGHAFAASPAGPRGSPRYCWRTRHFYQMMASIRVLFVWLTGDG